MNLDLLTIGDASLDAFIFPTESEALCQLDDKECLICFTYGDKIPVKDLEFSIGGNAANNAVGTSRLGIKNSIILTLGEDDIGEQITHVLEKEGVDTKNVIKITGKRSNYSLAINYSGERTIFTYKDEIDYKFPTGLPEVEWIYLTSMGDNFETAYQKVIDQVNKNPDIKLAFNPGSRQIRAGYEKIKNVMEASYIIYVNRSEAEVLTGMAETHGKEKELLQRLSERGPKISIITDGGNGSLVYNGEKFYKAGVLPVDAYERTGAGDSFGAGCLAALIKGKSFEEALLWGTVNSASVIGYIGGQKGLLKESEIQEWIERAKSCNVEVGEF